MRNPGSVNTLCAAFLPGFRSHAPARFPQEAEDLGVIDKHAGKVEHALAGRFLSSANAPAWPQLDVFEQGAKETTICQRPAPPARAMVVLACYRSSGQALLQPWRNRIIKALQGSPAVDLVELNLIDISVRACTCVAMVGRWVCVPW